MASTTIEVQITPYRGGAVTFDGAVTPIAVVPTTLFFHKTAAGQIAPNGSGYPLSSVAGWLYGCTLADALVGIYYWYAVDANANVVSDGYVYVAADDTSTYRTAKDFPSAFSQQLAEADEVLVDDGGVRKLRTYERGTTTELLPAKTAKQPDGSDLTDPTTQRLAGYRE